MKFKRITTFAFAALLATSCTGGDEEATLVEPDDARVVVDNAAPDTTTTSTTTQAPTTTTTTAAPASLAFASSQDVGRLFEVAGSQSLLDSAGGDVVGTVAGGTLVQATSARSADGELWVRVRSTNGELTTLGWVASDTLLPTTRSVETVDASLATEFRVSRLEQDIVSSAGGSSVVGTLSRGEVGMHGGTTVLAADGNTWVDVVNVSTRTRIGWVDSSLFTTLTSIEAQNDEGVDVGRRASSSVTYGAPLSVATVTQGCNAVQLRFASASPSLGTAIVFGQGVPVGRQVGSRVKWTASGGSTVYVNPGESVTFTFPADASRSWYFAPLNADLQADSNASLSDSVSEITATGATSYAVERGSCYVEPVVVPQEEGTRDFYEEEEELVDEVPEGEENLTLEGDDLLVEFDETTSTTTTTAISTTTTTTTAAPATTTTTTTTVAPATTTTPTSEPPGDGG